MTTKPKLIVVAGLPGTGKSHVAKILASRLGVPVFAKDELEAVLVRSDLAALENERLGYAGYELLTHCADNLLTAGASVALDSVCSFQRIRDGWRNLAKKHGAVFAPIECVCSDVALHEERIRNRVRGIPGWPELTWKDVLKVKSYYQPWAEGRFEIDSAEPMDVVEKQILRHFHFSLDDTPEAVA